MLKPITDTVGVEHIINTDHIVYISILGSEVNKAIIFLSNEVNLWIHMEGMNAEALANWLVEENV